MVSVVSNVFESKSRDNEIFGAPGAWSLYQRSSESPKTSAVAAASEIVHVLFGRIPPNTISPHVPLGSRDGGGVESLHPFCF